MQIFCDVAKEVYVEVAIRHFDDGKKNKSIACGHIDRANAQRGQERTRSCDDFYGTREGIFKARKSLSRLA